MQLERLVYKWIFIYLFNFFFGGEMQNKIKKTSVICAQFVHVANKCVCIF